MSWNGLKKQMNRAGANFNAKVGLMEKTHDLEWADQESKYRTVEKNTNELHKEAKNYLDAVRAMSASSARIAATLDLFYAGHSGDEAIAIGAYKRAVEDLENSVAQSVDAPYRTTVLEPIGRMCSYWPEVNTVISKRSKKLVDYDAARSKARKLADKPSDDVSKLPRAEAESEQAREIYEALDSNLKNELPVLLDLRIPYLDPSFEAMVRMQAHFASDGYEKLGGIQRYLPEGVRDEYAAGQLDQQVEGCLQEMKDLTICGLQG